MCRSVLTFGWLLDPDNLEAWIVDKGGTISRPAPWDLGEYIPCGWTIIGCKHHPMMNDFDDYDWMLTFNHVNGLTLDDLTLIKIKENEQLMTLLEELKVSGPPRLGIHHDHGTF